ncbi:MAG: dihydropteroate synthase [Chitinophagaceae bacterium]|nr:dihydropteroate synthase [Chitinophagaceae bacterium]
MFTLNCKGRSLIIEKPVVMGIINITPDSFYRRSRFEGTAILQQAEQMLKEGATILDIGGQSTRPGSERVSAEDEIKRVTGPVTEIHKNFPGAFISIDTYHAAVAKEAVAAGASIVNDISAGSMDKDMIKTVASLQVPYVLMHMKGTPETMQQEAKYDDVTKEVLDFFILKKEELQEAGITQVIIDPGFGFGKTIAQNFELLRNLSSFKMLNCPVMAGLSRKSTIYKTLTISPDEALNGTTVMNTIGLLNGAMILRVHDVKEAAQVIQLIEAYKK